MTKTETIIKGDLPKIIISIGAVFIVAYIASQFEPGEWYQNLTRPAWTPPDWIFAPVWTALYLMMGLAAWLIWRQRGLKAAAKPLGFFLFQLILNGAWSWLFFGQHKIGFAFAEIVLLWIAIFITLILFWKRTAWAGILLLPYLVWVGFASVLNYAFWRMN